MLLEGIRVVDLTTVVMGPLATRMLADMGADVIWIESPDGDVLRDYEPMRHAGMGAFSMSLSRNKRSVMLDLKTETGAQAVRDLIATADVFVTNLRRKAIDRLGLVEQIDGHLESVDLAELPEGIWRAKGIVSIEGERGRLVCGPDGQCNRPEILEHRPQRSVALGESG